MSEKPLITHLFTADPSAHQFEGKIYIYPSHDRDTGIPDNDLGDQYDMDDYHVFSMDRVDGEVVDHGVALALSDVPWASKQLWAPDAAAKNGRYYLYFPARDKQGVFRIGVAISERPQGPFRAEPEPIKGTYSIDPCSFVDDDGQAYLYFGGIWGGQLQKWRTGRFDPNGQEPADQEPAIGPRVAKLSADMKSLAGEVIELKILDEKGQPLLAKDHDRRYFEAPWVHKHGGLYYLSYSTGNTHYLVYATSSHPTGPFTYRGRLLEPVVGWTTHHSIMQFNGRWLMFHHDSSLSGGVSHLRCVKLKEVVHDGPGKLRVVGPV
ncbi:MAG TPA: glycoside hydrolase family 43 protein [Lacunisphaera sp.]|nr:glycoside hydrolase family 43 protein [Lacunisphaera sp.]